jgi:hypothetical protein
VSREPLSALVVVAAAAVVVAPVEVERAEPQLEARVPEQLAAQGQAARLQRPE